MICRLTIWLSVMLLAIAGCSGGSPADDAFQVLPSTDTASVEPAGPVYDPASATARITGNIVFDGVPPEMPMLEIGADFFCIQNARGLRDNEVMVTAEGRLQNVIVYVRSGHDDTLTYPAPSEPVLLDQERCVYIPRTLTIMTGQELLVRNSDDTFHNVHSDSNANTPFNFGQPVLDQENTQTFAQPEMPVTMGCDVHPWMSTVVGVFDHPFHTTSKDTGTFGLQLPPGTYEIAAWHELYGEQVATVEVSGGETAELDFTFTPPDA